MASINNLLALTVKSDSSALYLAEANVLRFFTDPITPGTGTLISYSDPVFAGMIRETTVTNTPVAVFAMTEMFIALTTQNGTEYFNGMDIVSIVTDGGSGSKVEFYGRSGVSNYVYASEAPLAVDKLVQALNLKTKTPASYTFAANTTPTFTTGAEMGTGLLLVTGTTGGFTTPSATALATALGATAGTSFDFIVDTVAMTGANTCTITLGSGILNIGAITGGDDLVMTAGAGANQVGKFTLYFTSTTAAQIYRIW